MRDKNFMANSWISYYAKLLISFAVYHFLDSHIHYSFILSCTVMNIAFAFFGLLPLFFVFRKYSPHICGIISEGALLIFFLAHSLRTLLLSVRNVGESGFGIAEIASIAPLFILNLIFVALDFRRVL